MQRPSEACFESMWNDGRCDANCNNLACGFNDCSASQSIVGCMAAQAESGMDLAVPPPDPSVRVVMGVSSPSLSMDAARNRMVYKASVSYLLQWEDSRLPQSPCFAVLGILLSRRPGEPIGHRAAFWVPDLAAVNGIDGANDDKDTSDVSVREESAVTALPGRRLAAGIPLSSFAALNASATRAQQFEQQFDFTFYPFDTHNVKLDLSAGDYRARLDCEAIAAQLGALPEGSLLPTAASSWRLYGAPTGEGMGGANATSTSAQRCVIAIPVARNAIVFIVQRLVPLVVMAGSALMVLNIDPSSAPAPGARIGALLSTMVLISLKGNSDLGLGELTSLIWIDYLKILQFLILLLAVLETSLVHHLIREGKKADAQRIDRICRIFMPFVLYPYLIACMLLIGMQYVLAGVIVLLVGCALLFLYAYARFKRGQRDRFARRARIVDACTGLDMSDEANLPLLEEAFAFFDVDGSGSIDASELHRCMRLLYPKLSRLQISREVKAMELSYPVIFEDFAEALSQLASGFQGLSLAIPAGRPTVTLGGSGDASRVAGGVKPLSSMSKEESDALRQRILGMWNAQQGGSQAGGGLTQAALLARAQSGSGSESWRPRPSASGQTQGNKATPGSESHR